MPISPRHWRSADPKSTGIQLKPDGFVVKTEYGCRNAGSMCSVELRKERGVRPSAGMYGIDGLGQAAADKGISLGNMLLHLLRLSQIP